MEGTTSIPTLGAELGSQRVRIKPSRGARIQRNINKAITLAWKPLYLAFLYAAGLYLIVPTIVVVLASVSGTSYVTFPPQGITLKWFANFFSRQGFVSSLVISLILAMVVALLSVAVSVLISVRFGRKVGAIQSIVVSTAYLPLLLPTIVFGPALLIWTSKIQFANSFWSAAITVGAAHLILAMPFGLQSILVGYERLDPSFEEAGLVMGAKPYTVFRYITLPLLMPAIIAGATFSFLISFDEPVVALFFIRPDFSTLPVQIFQYMRYKPDPTVAAIATITIILSMTLVAVADRFIGLGKLMGLRR